MLYKQRSLEEPILAPILVAEIIEKAQGVFLWVTLVVSSLIDGLWNDDNIIDPQKRLKKTTGWSRSAIRTYADEAHRSILLTASLKVFQILHAGLQPVPTSYHIEESELMKESERKQLTILDLALEDEDNTHLLKPNAKDLSLLQITSMCRSMCTQLKARCAGLVEIQGFESLLKVSSETTQRMKKPNYFQVNVDEKIQYLHRTVRDFLETPDTWKKIVGQTGEEIWNPNTCLLRSCVAQLSGARDALSEDRYHSVALQAMVHAHQADRMPSCEHFQLQRLDQVMVRNLNGSLSESCNHWATHDCFQYEHEDPNEEGYSISANQDSFISLAVQYGLCNFLADSFNKTKSCYGKSLGVPY